MIRNRSDARAVLAQLVQLKTATWDGNLISKQARDVLVQEGKAARMNGWNIATPAGLAALEFCGELRS